MAISACAAERSAWNDQLSGGAGDEIFEGLRGNDSVSGGAGSDTYLFGFDDGEDLVIEQGAASDIDRIAITAPAARKDVSVIREGDDLLLEFERLDGFLIDTLRVQDHFLGNETGIEEVVFADGTVWDRAQLDVLQGLGRFNAADDIVRFAVEDEPILIDPAELIANDTTDPALTLTFLGVDQPTDGTVSVNQDGMIEFLGAPDFNGDAYFYYTVGDNNGRESTARVEVNLSPVHDAPTAVDDPLQTGVEDEILRIRIDQLLANDFDVDGDANAEGLHIVAIAPLKSDTGDLIEPYRHRDYSFYGTNVTGSVGGDYVTLKPRPDYFGTAGFVYTLADADGATSTATVELYFTPVNDAPRADDDTRTIRLGTQATITVDQLLAYTHDIEGDAITFMGLHGGADENPASNGSVAFDEAAGTITFTPASLGSAGLDFNVIDERGAASTLTYRLWVRPLNDPPTAHADTGLRTLEDQTLLIDPATLLANDTDPNGDTLTFESVERFADGGKVQVLADGTIEFRPTADYNGSAGFEYTISDPSGATSTAYVLITVLPRNSGPILRDDFVSGLEDGPLFIIPAETFGNDIEPDGDVIFFERASVLGVVDHRFLSAGFETTARLANGGELPGWMSYDGASMTLSGTAPNGETGPFEIDVWLTDPANGRIFNTRLSLSAAALEAGHSAETAVLSGFEVRADHAQSLAFGADTLGADVSVSATGGDGSALPAWLSFDAASLSFTGTPPQDATAPVDVTLTFSRPDPQGGAALEFSDTFSLDPAALSAGVVYDSAIAVFDIAGATVSASLIGNRPLAEEDPVTGEVPLPYWLSFDAATRTVSQSGFDPEADADTARLQVRFDIPQETLPVDTFGTARGGFTLEFVIDPAGDIAAQVAAVNDVLAGDSWFAGQDIFALDLSGAGVLDVARESGADLPAWLGFDASSLTFEGTPPPAWVGSLPVRVDVPAGGGLPQMAILTEAVVDATYRLIGQSGLGVATADERLDLAAPTDFNGTIVLDYDAADEKGGSSDAPARIFYDIKPTRERPDAGADALAGIEGQTLRFAVADLLANDFDRDGDAVHVAGFGQPENGAIVVELAHIEIAPPAELGQEPGAVWSATLADGGILPVWLAIDSTTGVVSGDVPLDYAGTLEIEFIRDDAGTVAAATVSHAVNGNDGAFAVYTPNDAFSGLDHLTYQVSDGREGASHGAIAIDVAPVADPPVAVDDTVAATEDTALLIDPATLLANDYDVDGDPIRFVDVANAAHGTVEYDGTTITFTPDANFSGKASFEYVVTDDRHGSSSGRVTVNVASTNRAPVAGLDEFDTLEDTPFEFTTAELLANDSDADGDAIRFESLARVVEGGRISQLPGSRWQFTPDENVFGDISFGYFIGDGRARTTGTVTFHVAPVNDAPIANPDGAETGNNPAGVFVTDQDTPVTIDFADLIVNDRDVEGDTFSIVEVFDGDQGFVIREGDTAVLTPYGGYIGDAGFSYRVTDEHGATSVGIVTLLVYPDYALPVASSDHGFEVLEDGYIDIAPDALLANDTVPDGSTISFVGLDGTELQADGNYRYTPTPDFNGTVQLRYTIENEQGFPISSFVEIEVLPVGDAPVAVNDALAMVEDEPLVIFASQLFENDSDADGEVLVINRIIDSVGVAVADIGFGQLEITPDADFNGDAWFEYELIDADGLRASARVDVAVDAVNDAPEIAPIPVLRGLRNKPFAAVLSEGFASDIDGDALLIEVRAVGGAALPAWLSWDPVSRTLGGTPPADFTGTVELEILAADASEQAIREVLVSIEPGNTAPVIVNALADVTSLEDTALSFVIPAGSFSDVDGDALTLTATLANGDALPGWLVFDGTTFAGTPPQDFNGLLDIAVTASDGELSVSDTFALMIDPVNDAPVVATPLGDQTVIGGTSVDIVVPSGAFSDVDGDTLTLSASLADGSALPGWLVFDAGTGGFTGSAPNADATFDIRVSASDGSLSASDDFVMNIEADDGSGGSTGGFAFASVNSWYDPVSGGGYEVTFSYTVQADAIIDGELKAWDMVATYDGPGTVTGGWLGSFNGGASFTGNAGGAIISTVGQDYQPDLIEGTTFQITLQVDGAPYSEGEFEFVIYDRDPPLNLADALDTQITIQPTNDWGSGLTQNVTLTNVSTVTVDEWHIVLDVPDGITFEITQVWGATTTQLANGDIQFDPVDWSEEISAGASVSFGFNANYSGASSLQFASGDFAFLDADGQTPVAPLAAMVLHATEPNGIDTATLDAEGGTPPGSDSEAEATDISDDLDSTPAPLRTDSALAIFGLSGDSASFDRFATGDFGSPVGTSMAQSTGQRAQLQPVTLKPMDEEETSSISVQTAEADATSAKLMMLMRQDMAAFGDASASDIQLAAVLQDRALIQWV